MRLVPNVLAAAGLGLVLWALWGVHVYLGGVATGVLLIAAAESFDDGEGDR